MHDFKMVLLIIEHGKKIYINALQIIKKSSLVLHLKIVKSRIRTIGQVELFLHALKV